MNNRNKTIGRVLLVFGIAGGFISFWYTLQFTWTPEFAAVNLPEGPTHSNYHAFREALLALAVNLLLVWIVFKGATIKVETWAVITFMAVFYYAGWWLAWPIWGYHAPNLVAEMNHVIGTIGGLAGLTLLRPQHQV
ncbi:MAG: hypothetical protein AAF639_06290 [Chloroflexota bacterium]